jgi:hypothetical protein
MSSVRITTMLGREVSSARGVWAALPVALVDGTAAEIAATPRRMMKAKPRRAMAPPETESGDI